MSTSHRAARRSRARPRRVPASPKARGELAEARFLAKAMELGFTVSKPFGDNARYDFVVETAGRLSRVQVKSAWTLDYHCARYLYVVAPRRRGRHNRAYRRSEIEFVAAYIAPEDAWFIIPVDRLPRGKTLRLSLRPTHPFAPYREAWELLREPARFRRHSS